MLAFHRLHNETLSSPAIASTVNNSVIAIRQSCQFDTSASRYGRDWWQSQIGFSSVDGGGRADCWAFSGRG